MYKGTRTLHYLMDPDVRQWWYDVAYNLQKEMNSLEESIAEKYRLGCTRRSTAHEVALLNEYRRTRECIWEAIEYLQCATPTHNDIRDFALTRISK